MKLVTAQQLTATLVSDAVLDAAFAWLCRQRRDWPANADVWSFRRNWLKFERPRVQSALLSGIAKEAGTLLAVAKDDRLLAKADLPRPVWNAQYMCQGNDGTLPASYRATS
jgi:hypothetical protein